MPDRIELGLERGIDHAAADLDDQPADDRGIDSDRKAHVLAGHRLECALKCREVRLGPSHRRSPSPWKSSGTSITGASRRAPTPAKIWAVANIPATAVQHAQAGEKPR